MLARDGGSSLKLGQFGPPTPDRLNPKIFADFLSRANFVHGVWRVFEHRLLSHFIIVRRHIAPELHRTDQDHGTLFKRKACRSHRRNARHRARHCRRSSPLRRRSRHLRAHKGIDRTRRSRIETIHWRRRPGCRGRRLQLGSSGASFRHSRFPISAGLTFWSTTPGYGIFRPIQEHDRGRLARR